MLRQAGEKDGLLGTGILMKIQIPAAAQEIVEKLCEHGYEAYLVGGCVRDMLLGREPGDWDITTSAKPEEVKAVFRRTVDTGIKHGTVTVMMGKEGYEVTTFRIDGDYTDGRHPDSVTFTPDLIEDLKRRDFTINAMAYNRDRGLVDAFGGRKDLEDGVIRCVGAAEERFTEDALRILRAIRFSAQLGFEIEEHTENAIKKTCSQSGPCKPGAGSGGAYKASYKPPSRTHPAGLRDRDQPLGIRDLSPDPGDFRRLLLSHTVLCSGGKITALGGFYAEMRA